MKIRIIRCNAFGPEFINLTPGSVHEVIKTPEGETGTWIMGVSEPVKVFAQEYVVIE